MKNIIPFKKDVIFKTNIEEITSISLENTLEINNDTISGDFIISGEYKITDSSNTVDPFKITLPFEIMIDERYDSSQANVDIDDFYYEIVNNNVLSVSIDVLLDHLKEKEIIELEDLTDVEPNITVLEDNMNDNLFNDNDTREEIKEEVKEVNEEVRINDNISSIFSNTNLYNEEYVTYSVYIIKEGDNIESICEKYSVSLENIQEYNDINDLKIGDKIIIPTINYEGI